MMMIYVFLWRTILGFIAWGVRILLVKFGFIGKIEWDDSIVKPKVGIVGEILIKYHPMEIIL